jgi:uncharacterized protein YjbI with pentapeptide repeats
MALKQIDLPRIDLQRMELQRMDLQRMDLQRADVQQADAQQAGGQRQDRQQTDEKRKVLQCTTLKHLDEQRTNTARSGAAGVSRRRRAHLNAQTNLVERERMRRRPQREPAR